MLLGCSYWKPKEQISTFWKTQSLAKQVKRLSGAWRLKCNFILACKQGKFCGGTQPLLKGSTVGYLGETLGWNVPNRHSWVAYFVKPISLSVISLRVIIYLEIRTKDKTSVLPHYCFSKLRLLTPVATSEQGPLSLHKEAWATSSCRAAGSYILLQT